MLSPEYERKNKMENINSFLLSLTAIVMSLCGLIVAIKKTKKELETALPGKIKKQCSIDLTIIDKMERVKEILGADRVQVYDFHNRRTLCKWKKCIKDKL